MGPGPRGELVPTAHVAFPASPPTSCPRSCAAWAAGTWRWCRRRSGACRSTPSSARVSRPPAPPARLRSGKAAAGLSVCLSRRARGRAAAPGLPGGHVRPGGHQLPDLRGPADPAHGGGDVSLPRPTTRQPGPLSCPLGPPGCPLGVPAEPGRLVVQWCCPLGEGRGSTQPAWVLQPAAGVGASVLRLPACRRTGRGRSPEDRMSQHLRVRAGFNETIRAPEQAFWFLHLRGAWLSNGTWSRSPIHRPPVPSGPACSWVGTWGSACLCTGPLLALSLCPQPWPLSSRSHEVSSGRVREWARRGQVWGRPASPSQGTPGSWVPWL